MTGSNVGFCRLPLNSGGELSVCCWKTVAHGIIFYAACVKQQLSKLELKKK